MRIPLRSKSYYPLDALSDDHILGHTEFLPRLVLINREMLIMMGTGKEALNKQFAWRNGSLRENAQQKSEFRYKWSVRGCVWIISQ